MLDRMQLAVANERDVEFGDAPEGDQDNRRAFVAHFPSLQPALETWEAVVRRLEERMQNFAEWIPQEVRERGFNEPAYFDGTVAQCFTESTLLRARRHELAERREIHLRCVEDVVTQDGGKRWSAYLHSGQNEFKVAELSIPVTEFSEVGMADLHKLIAFMDHTLQACFDALQRSAAAGRVTVEQEALEAVRQPLRDQLKRQKLTASPTFAKSCPYCLVEIGVAS
jgi:hypothetical protein